MTNNNHLYDTKEQRWDTIIGQISYLGKLRRAKEDYQHIVGDHNNDQFLTWLYETYGISVAMQDGDMSSEYEVHDEKKFLLFELKYTI